MKTIRLIALGLTVLAALLVGQGQHTAFAQTDSDGDSMGLSGSLGPWFRDEVEVFIGTDPLDDCADTSTSNDERGPAYAEPLSPWPPDFNDTGMVTSGDAVLFAQHYQPLGRPYSPRYDLNADGVTTVGDLVIFSKYYFGSGHNQCTVG
jgi:hypothetical protein